MQANIAMTSPCEESAGDREFMGTRRHEPGDRVPGRLMSSQVATVVSGEASESDDEDATYSGTSGSRHTSQASSLDDSFDVTSAGRRFSEPSHYNTLLHRKLRERNLSLRKNLTDMACQPYQNAAKEIAGITQSLIRSQQLVQEVSTTLRRLTNELFQLEDKVETVRHCNIIPEITVQPYLSVHDEH